MQSQDPKRWKRTKVFGIFIDISRLFPGTSDAQSIQNDVPFGKMPCSCFSALRATLRHYEGRIQCWRDLGLIAQIQENEVVMAIGKAEMATCHHSLPGWL